jgi:hypothetical protein
MMHSHRIYRVVDRVHGELFSTPPELARILRDHVWCTCNGFRIEHLVFLNDSTGPDGAQEYAVFDTRSGKQIESLTVSWYASHDKLADEIRSLLAGGGVVMSAKMPSFGHAEGSCASCA